MSKEYDQLKKEFKDDPSDVEKHLSRLLEMVTNHDHDSEELIQALKHDFLDPLMDRVKTMKNKHEDILVKMCIEFMKKKKAEFYDGARRIFEEKKMVKWKGHEHTIEQITHILEEPIDCKATERALEDNIKAMLKACSRDKIIKDVAWSFRRLFASCIQSGSEMHHVVAIAIANCSGLTWEDSEDLIAKVMETFDKWLRQDDVDLEENKDHKALARAICSNSILSNAGKSSSAYLKNIMEYCLDQELEEDDESLSAHGQIIQSIVYSFVLAHARVVETFQDLLPYVTQLLESDVKELQGAAKSAMELIKIYENVALSEEEDVDAVVDAYLDDTNDRAFAGIALMRVIQSSPEAIPPRVDRIARKMKEFGTSDKQFLYGLLFPLCFGKAKYELVASLAPHVDVLVEDVCDPTFATQAFPILAEISIQHAENLIKHTDKFLEVWEHTPQMMPHACKVFGNIGILNEEEAAKSLKIFFSKCDDKNPMHAMWTSCILTECKRIGDSFKECIAVYRSDIEKLKTSKQMGVPEMVQYLLDSIDGISLHGLSGEVQEQGQDISSLDCRVTNTEFDVEMIDGIVSKHGDEIQQVKNEMGDQGERLGELEEVVDETVEKVEEIDHKTITNAPKWSRDVSKLLNPEHEHDWRFLAIRLGYSGEDIRNWALSPDPTMAILAEWYTTHKSSDATYAILNALEDMGRTDATEIITHSLEQAERLMPQAPRDRSEKTPAVFLSYQWDHQPEVKAIKKHLEMAGFPCWMDIGQMGGGDQLFAKISEGMRSSKVVLCMVTEKYSKSENCNKEANLANLLNKPIIPILIDQIRWPPEGAMSMLFAQLLYIQFYNDKEYVRGEKFWEDAKFSELLGQISYHVNPDQSMVTDEYRNWVPKVDDVLVTKKKVSDETKSSGQQHESQTMGSTDQPSVFISYQWGKQPEIKRLFSRLTDFGYHCWLDINQMGGGDPLYSKIEKGIRNAKVVLSCITPKYAVSPNCRREVSLSDVLRKPIIPLLLEEMAWPPEGPMGMTLTELIYIDFTKESSQASFDGEKLEELLMKIKEHAQPTLAAVQVEETTTI